MTDPLTPDDADESAGKRENFVGRVVRSAEDCSCETCEKGRSSANEQGFEIDHDSRYDHVAEIKPLDGTYDNNMSVLGVNVNASPGSKWMTLMDHIAAIHGDLRGDHGVSSVEEVGDFLKGRVYEWQDITWKEEDNIPGREFSYAHAVSDYSETPNSMLLPVRELDESELAEIDADGEEDPGGVEEIDIGE